MKTKLLFTALVFLTFASVSGQPYPEVPPGSGTFNDPYQIQTLAHLNWIAHSGNCDNVYGSPNYHCQPLTGKFFIQTQDIDASETGTGFMWGSEGWRPAGRVQTFNGYYDGQGYSIENLFTDQTYCDICGPAGLFSITGPDAEIRNLILTNINMTGNNQFQNANVIGGLVGENHGVIENCHVDGEISTGLKMGGLAGVNYGTIEVSSANCTVSGEDYVGGIAGENYNLIDNCTFYGDLTGEDYLGGIAGISYGIISNSHSHVSSGEIAGIRVIGGLVGRLTQIDDSGVGKKSRVEDTPGMIVNCYATSNVSGNSRIGGLVGEIYYGGIIDSCYAEGNVTAPFGSWAGFGGLVGEIYMGGEIYVSYAKGHVNAEQHYGVGGLVGNAETHQNGGYRWEVKPIVIDQCFASGHVNGSGSVGGLVGSFTDWESAPEKSRDTSAVRGIRNSFAIGDVSGHENVGGLIGSLLGVGTVSFTYATGDVSGVPSQWSDDSYQIGGLTGNNEGEIQQSYFTGTVNGTFYIGGLAGSNNGLIQDSYAMYESGDIDGEDFVGGVAGYNSMSASIINCYTPGNISVFNWIHPNHKDFGYLVGHNEYYEENDEIYSGLIEHSIHPGTKETCASGGPGDGKGDCSWMGVGNMYPDPPGAISVSYLSVMQQQSTYTDEGWDFDSIWEIETYGYNQGLPYHQWQKNVVPILPVMGITMGYEESSCYNATQKILLEDFVMHDGNSATLISGHSIIMTPGVQIDSGAYFRAYITPDSTFCVNPTPLMLAEDENQDDEPFVPSIEKEIFFHIFPNPTTGLFTLEMKKFDISSAIVIEISSIMGESIIRQELPAAAQYQIDLSRYQPGIYLVRVIQGKEAGVLKVVRK
jgi:hypothetical protein